MAAIFEVTSQVLRQKADELRTQNDKLKGQIDELRSTEGALSSFFESESRQKFHAAVEQDLAKMEQFKNTIPEYAAALDIAAAEYEKAEARAASLAGTRRS